MGPKRSGDLNLTRIDNENDFDPSRNGEITTVAQLRMAQFPGILFFNSKITFGQIPDGASNTFLIGERDGAALVSSDTRAQQRSASVWCANGKAEWLNTFLAPTSLDPLFTLNSIVGTTASRWEPFASSHPGGANFGRGDGSVVFVPDTVDGQTYQAMGTRSGGEVFDAL